MSTAPTPHPTAPVDAREAARRDAVPAEPAERERIRAEVRAYVATRRLVPPLTIEELREHARAVREAAALPATISDFVTVLISNAVWRDTLAGVPCDRRILLLPQCLRDPEHCPAELDAYGVLCAQCGRCPIGPLQEEAERLGYVALVAEGTTVVTRLIESGRADAVVGVSCLAVLERAFPHLAAEAVPAVAVPLLCDGCLRTAVDVAWVREALHLRAAGGGPTRPDLERLRGEVEGWFTPEALAEEPGLGDGAVERLAAEWLVRGGKRWRPFALAAVCGSLRHPGAPLPTTVRRLALATECFHKASLLHDDIEDDDAERYGRPTLHRETGVPCALNAGDFLLGEGYRLIARCGAPAADVVRMTELAAGAHRALCVGQGRELAWTREPAMLTPEEVLDIFRLKTAPAFETALRLGAIAAGADDDCGGVLHAYCRSLGVAYQVRDDLEDHGVGGPPRPSALYALTCSYLPASVRDRLVDRWLHGPGDTELPEPALIAAARKRAEEKARQWLEHYRNEAVRALAPLQSAPLKSLLRRMIGRILG